MRINRVYQHSDKFKGNLISYNKQAKPSWIKFKTDKKVQFIRAEHNNIQYWYRRYFKDYFLIFNPSPKDYSSYYDEIAEQYDDMVPQNFKIVEFIIKKMNKYIDKNSSILELSAGTGILSQSIVNTWSNLTITDISQNCLEIARKKTKLSENNVIVSDILKLKISKKFDAIVELMGLDYFSEDEMELISNKIVLSMKNKGILIIVDRHHYPSFENKLDVLKKGVFNIKTPTGIFPYFYTIAIKN